MNFDSIKEQFKALFTRIWQQIQESNAYAQAQDRYENLSPSGQKLVGVAGLALAILILLAYPLSNFSTSQASLSMYEEKRNLIRDLFKTYRESSAAPAVPVPPALEMLRSSVNSVISRAELLPEQMQGVAEASVEGKLIPQGLISHVLEVKLAKLNLKQIVDIGAGLVGISESVKMKDMMIRANAADTRYFDVTYKLYSLNVPETAPELPPEPEPKSKRGSDR